VQQGTGQGNGPAASNAGCGTSCFGGTFWRSLAFLDDHPWLRTTAELLTDAAVSLNYTAYPSGSSDSVSGANELSNDSSSNGWIDVLSRRSRQMAQLLLYPPTDNSGYW
jgi:hypothetical protein